jgi:hypothetical protein
MTDAPTIRLALPLLQPGQAQKEMYHNEALARLDFAAQAAVVAADMDSPPGDPDEGACWIVGDTPTGDWAGQAGAIACWTASGWRFLAPFEGMRAWVTDSQGFALFSDGTWRVGDCYGRLILDGVQVVGPQGDAIDDPEGGATVDEEARNAIVAILEALRGHGLIDPG